MIALKKVKAINFPCLYVKYHPIKQCIFRKPSKKLIIIVYYSSIPYNQIPYY